MRPKDRLRRRGIPKTAIHDGLEAWSDRLSNWERVWTAIVVLGLAFEVVATLSRFLPHDWYEAIRPHLPTLSDFGTAIVFVGVLGELVVSSKSGRVETDLRDENKTIVSELNAEIERLRKENNDTALLLRYRSIGDPAAFEETMRRFSGTKYTLEFPSNSWEGGTFGNEISLALTRAGWIGSSVPVARPYLGFGVYVFTVQGPDCITQSKAGVALADWLDERSIATLSALATPDAALASPDAKPDDLEPGSIVIRVGSKPETIEQQRGIQSEYLRRKQYRSVTPSQG
jgi:hypothetical protein